VAKHFLLSEGKTWGYDPFFLAGYPRCALLDADNKAWELFVILFSFLSEGFAFKLYLILFLLGYPFLLYFAARNFNLTRKESIIAPILAMLFFFLSIAIDCVSWGMVSYVFVSYLSLYAFSIFYKWCNYSALRQYLILLFLSPVLLLMHIISPILLFVPSLTLYLLYFKKMKKLDHLMIVFLVIVILLLNSYWLVPLATFYHQITPYEYFGSYKPFQIYNIWEPFNVYIKQNSIFNPRPSPVLNNPFFEVILLLFGLVGFYLWIKEKKDKVFLFFLLGTLFLFVIGYYGSHTNFFAKFQPQRFLIPLNIFLIIPASRGIHYFLEKLFQGKSVKFKLFAFSLAFVALVHPVAKPLKTIYKYKIYLLSSTIPQPINNLLNWIRNHTSQEARILIEDSAFDSGHQYYGTHLPALFPHYVQREYICGPHPYFPIKHGFASFTSGLLFEKRVEDYSLEELKEYFELYNIKWIVCWFEESKKLFNQYPEYMKKLEEIDKFTIYQVDRAPSFFLKGDGIIKSDYNRLELHKVVAENGEVIIKYHWMRFLKTEPPLKMGRVQILDDPVGFIKILDPPSSLTLFNGY